MLAAAAKVFCEQGYVNASVQDVAEELGILKGSLYHYIDTKEDLLFRVLSEVAEDTGQILREVEEEADSMAPLDALRLYALRQVEFSMDHQVRVAVYHREIEALSESSRRLLVERHRRHERFVVGLIEQAQARGEVQPAFDPGALSKCVFATIVWTARWYSPLRDARRHFADRCAEFVVCGLSGPLAEGA